MMRRNTFVMLASFALLVLVASSAQAGGSVFAGLSLPQGDFGDYADTGFHGGLAYSTPVAPTFSVGGMGSYHYWGLKAGDENAHMLEILGFGKLTTPGGLFGMVGLGMGNLGSSVQGSESETKLATAFGGGYSFTMVEVTALYHMISTEGSTTKAISLSAGIGF